VAALIKQDTGAETIVEPGARGEFSVWVDGKKVAEKSSRGFPQDAELVQAVKQALQ
jgi:predicted Rdx family selenoprotein